ncbi:uncharacterized protein LOC129769346 [Toxorhynchites rutilus septentrionalis]|uniref:uncharacterized protein LOC129769346 n=1 Tax=Toxorhynchites rutilus septentrionalis TaxID=329112 RepID=UPI002478AB7F|nr:uncharacterized protein LOC129769346 [Toxorhynchites rutilus septentrionalis]
MSNVMVLTLTVLLAAVAHPQLVPGVRVNLTALAKQTIPGDCAVPTAGKSSICTNCTAMSVCIGGSASGAISCSGNYQYCNPGEIEASCSTNPAEGCGGTSGSQVTPMVCSDMGVFPDPGNCNYYHVCLSETGRSYLYECPQGTSFNIDAQQCRAQSAAGCTTCKCGTTSGFVYYGNSRVYYCFCSVVNGVTTSFIKKCPNRATFSMDTMSCVFNCPGQGNFANSNRPSTYFQCYIMNGRWVANLVSCPIGTIFNQTLSYCT